MKLTTNQMRASLRAWAKRNLTGESLTDLDDFNDAKVEALYNKLRPDHETASLVVNAALLASARWCSINEAAYAIQFEEHARRTGTARDGVREIVLTRMADKGWRLEDLLLNSDDENLRLYNGLLANEAAEEGEVLRAASRLRTTVHGASQVALASLGLSKLMELQALVDRATASISAG
jgi:hypothetical protein